MPQGEKKPIDLLILIGNLFFWFLVYSIGKHPDAPWGDGLGYANAVESGWDLATNANSHFLYLNLHHLIYQLFGLENALVLLGWSSVFWAIFSLFGVYLIGYEWKGKTVGIIALNLLASCFPFWRHASIPEVYTMELCFWVFLIYFFLKCERSGNHKNLLFFFLVHSIGLLTHIHLILVFPAIFLFFFHRRKWPIQYLLVYLIPMAVVFYSVLVIKTNSFPQVFFDSIQDQMLTFNWKDKWIGPLFTVFILVFMFPTGILFWGLSIFRTKKNRELWKDFESRFLLTLALPVVGFTSLYPDPGIYVFLLPAFLILSLLSAAAISRSFYQKIIIQGILLSQVSFFFISNGLYAQLASAESLQKQEIKGGPGFLFLPWAKGNVASVLEKTEGIPLDSVPENGRWNIDHAILWKKNHPDWKSYSLEKR